MLVDYERGWLELRAFVQTKSGHGTFGPGGLLAKMAALEVECAVQEGPTERILRLFGVQVSEDLINLVEAATGKEPNGHALSQGSHRDTHGGRDSANRREAAPD